MMVVCQVIFISIILAELSIHKSKYEQMNNTPPAITRDKRSIYQGASVKDLSGGSMDNIFIFGSVKTTEELSAMTEDDKKAAMIDIVSDNSVHSQTDLQSWTFEGDGQSVASLAMISFFLKSRGLKTSGQLQQMSFQDQYDELVLQMVSTYGQVEDMLRQMTVLDLVIRKEFLSTICSAALALSWCDSLNGKVQSSGSMIKAK